MLRILLIALISLVLPATTASAQDSPRAILVLDGSGSMWGQIDGVNKIVIAREVIGELLGTLPAEQELGLMSYGHRRKGDCSDIELLIEPGTDRAAIAAAVNAINPKGKTPLSDAVIKAAEALRFSEEVATVILVSDGIETCERDPCAVGRMLEETGVNFTAHVIGFDVADPEALAQLQCLAEETGGQFRTAANAAELADALSVVAEPEPAPLPVEVTFRATDGENGPVIGTGLIWTIMTDADGALVDNGNDPSPSLELLPGAGRAEVLRLSDEAVGVADFTVTRDETGGKVVTIALPAFVPDATLDAPATAPAGSLVPVRWTGPDAKGDYISSSNLDMHDGEYYHYAYTANSEDGVVMVRMPPEDGIYEVRYILSDGTKVLARREIEVTPLDITLTPPDGAVIGTNARAGWTGPDYDGDYLSIARPDADDGQYETYAYTATGTPATITMPSEPGTYELRYILGVSSHVAARALFEVVETETFVNAPETAPEGATIKVTWAGPDGQNDYISIAPMGADDAKYLAYTYTRTDNPLKLTLPMGPGAYEIRYVLGQDRTVLARAPITLTQVTASLDAADTAAAGSELKVTWAGPDYDRDYVAIAEADAEDNKYLAYAYTGNGNPARFQAPLVPGDYELRYYANATKDVVLARRAVTITAVTATLDAPDSAPAGSVLKIGWTGPDNERDYVAIAEADADDNRYLAYGYTANGNPVKVLMPTTPGDYELRYVANGNPDVVLARQPIRIEAVGATLTAPASADAGSILKVDWTGPGGERDFISVAELDHEPGRYLTYAYTRNGNPARITLPTTPGSYEIRYVQNGAPDVVLASMPLEITAISATLNAPASADAGSILKVDWTGPGGERDFIAVAELDHEPGRFLTYVYARNGNPARIKLPTEPGSYELRYVQNGNPDKIIASTPLEVTAVGARLEAPASVGAGSILKVDWTGPGGERDFIAIADPDDEANRYQTYDYARNGNPARIKVPTVPGSYELRYVLDGSPDMVIARTPLEVTEVAATLDATPSAAAGSTLKVTWEGPGGDRDFIAIAEPDEDPNRYLTYGYARDGNPVSVQVPTEPGSYELRYVLDGTPDRIIGSTMLEVTAVEAMLDAPSSAAAGSNVTVTWEGPAYSRDYLAIALPDEKPGRYADYAYARDGSPSELKMPETPGTYELRYVLSGNQPAIIARRTLIVE